jgi:hypothetical protein
VSGLSCDALDCILVIWLLLILYIFGSAPSSHQNLTLVVLEYYILLPDPVRYLGVIFLEQKLQVGPEFDWILAWTIHQLPCFDLSLYMVKFQTFKFVF